MSSQRVYHPDNEDAGNGEDFETNNKQEEKSSTTCGVRYGAMNWIGEFRAPAKYQPKFGSHVVIQSERGIELGEQIDLLCTGLTPTVDRAQVKEYTDNSGSEFYRFRAGRILREASTQDINEHERLNGHVQSDIDQCVKFTKELGLKMKVITAEHLLGGERIIFYFRAEGRIDFRELVRRLAQHYQTRIEMRQVGARDEARLIADDEICGRECCCRHFLKKLRPVTMRMAKLQKSTLDPSKVSGRCGRLRCCLRYEHVVYDELLHNLPKVGARVETEFGTATVIDRHILTQLLMVRGDDDHIVTIPVEELRAPSKDKKRQTTPAPEQPETPEVSKFQADEAANEKQQAPESANGEADQQRPRRRRRSRRKKKNGEGNDASKNGATESTSEGAAPGENVAEKQSSSEEGGSRRRSSRSRRRRRSRRNGPGSSSDGEQGSQDNQSE